MVPAIDDTTCSTLSKPILNLLRHQGHFDGVIISDSLVMQGITALCNNLSDAAIQAINAGCDMLLIGGRCLIGSTLHEVTYDDIAQVHAALVGAVQSGQISKDRLDNSVTRILKLKNSYPPTSPFLQIANDMNKHHQLSSTVAARALNTLRTSNRTLPRTVYEYLEISLTTLMEMYHEEATQLYSR